MIESRVEKQRVARGLSQADGGIAIGKGGRSPEQAWRRIVRGEVSADVPTVEAIAALLDMPFAAVRADLDRARLAWLARNGRRIAAEVDAAARAGARGPEAAE